MSLLIEKNLQVPMRDGVRLATDVYRPAGDGRHPVVLLRLPYNKEQPALLFLAGDILRIAHAGYAVVVQDCRGTWQSGGEFSPFFQEAADGADTIAWAAAQPWSTGAVGMMGASYYGATQWLAAGESPPALKAMAPFITTDQYYDKWTYQGGAFQLGFILQWATATFGVAEALRRVLGGTAAAASIGEAIAAADAVAARYWHTPLSDLPGLADRAPYVADWLAHPDYDDYWKAIAPCERYDRITAPALNFGGWYDLFLGGTLANYRAMKSRCRQKLVIGPWVHGYNGGVYAERNFGLMAHDAVADVTAEQIRWFDHHLKGEANGVPHDKPVKIFVMGADAWREEDDWPLPDTDWQRWYLHSGGRAASDADDGRLSTQMPGEEAPDSYVYDPRDPVPTVGGATFLPGLFVAANAGPRDQRAVEARADVLVYTGEVLARDLEVTGPVTLVLHVASDALDTDFTGKLVDVHPDGRAMLLTDGILRARYREGYASPTPLVPGTVVRIEIDLVATSNVFRAGHRLRLEVSSSNFPRFDRNSNTGGLIARESAADFRVARNTVWHDATRPSHLLLPVIVR
ncbi:MAG TPA: CocE/NonD family hydrolase [Gammaproteobacteria bacterium]|nr:CocE/NonD family hydrolase [Gammaproteobacteria bacterium]